MDATPAHFTPSPAEIQDGVVTKYAVTCGVCQASADQYVDRFQCQRNPNHVGDLIDGIFSDLTYPAPADVRWAR